MIFLELVGSWYKYIFDSIEELKEITQDWLIEYDYKRPHLTLGELPPKIFLN